MQSQVLENKKFNSNHRNNEELFELTSSFECSENPLSNYLQHNNEDYSLTSDSNILCVARKPKITRNFNSSFHGTPCRNAFKERSLLASEAALESARQRAIDRRNCKVTNLRSRMQTRHEQVEARKRELEAAHQLRLIGLLQKQNNGQISRNDMLNCGLRYNRLRDTPSRACLERGVINNTPGGKTASCRPVVAFGSTAPRLACLTIQQLQPTDHTNGNNANTKALPPRLNTSLHASTSLHQSTISKDSMERSLHKKMLSQTYRENNPPPTVKCGWRQSQESHFTQRARSEYNTTSTRIRRIPNGMDQLTQLSRKDKHNRSATTGRSQENGTHRSFFTEDISAQKSNRVYKVQQIPFGQQRSNGQKKSFQDMEKATFVPHSERLSRLERVPVSTSGQPYTSHQTRKSSKSNGYIVTNKNPNGKTTRKRAALSCGDTVDNNLQKVNKKQPKVRNAAKESCRSRKGFAARTAKAVLEELATRLVDEVCRSSIKVIGNQLSLSTSETSNTKIGTTKPIDDTSDMRSTDPAQSNVKIEDALLEPTNTFEKPVQTEETKTNKSLPVLTFSSEQELVEREERRKRLQLVMSRFRTVRKFADKAGTNIRGSESLQSLVHASTEQTNQSQDQSTKTTQEAPVENLEEQPHLLHPSSSMLVSQNSLRIVSASVGDLSSMEECSDTNKPRSSSCSRTNILANLVASGRLPVTSRTATVLLNISSGRSPAEKWKLEDAKKILQDTGPINSTTSGNLTWETEAKTMSVV